MKVVVTNVLRSVHWSNLIPLAALRAARFASVSNGSKSFKVTKDFTQMALSVQKHLRMANIMILNNPY